MRLEGLKKVLGLLHIPVWAENTPSTLENAERSHLEARIRFLENQLRDDRYDLRLYWFGAGSFLLAVTSLLMWKFTGTATPLNPTFAIMAVPTSLGVMAMAFLFRREILKKNKGEK